MIIRPFTHADAGVVATLVGLLLYVCLGPVTAALGFDEPEASFGATEAVCYEVDHLQWCAAEITVGSIRVRVNISFRAGVFQSVYFRFDRQHFDEMKALFSQQYGSPSYDTGDVAVWAGQRFIIRMNRDAGWLRSDARIEPKSGIDQFKYRQLEQRNRAIIIRARERPGFYVSDR